MNISLPVFEMGAKTSTAVVPYGLRSKRSSKKENYRSLWAMASNTKNADEPYGRSILQDKQDLQGLESRGGLRVSLVRSG